MPLTSDVQKAKEDPRALSPQALSKLQRTIGNKAVHRLFRKTIQRPHTSPDKEMAKAPPRVQPAYDTSKVTGSHSKNRPRPTGDRPQLIKTFTLSGQNTIQRFNSMKDNPYVPTTDLGHPALTNAGGLAAMGPYKFYPMQGKFEYQAPKIAGDVGNFLLKVTQDKNPANIYPAEKMAAVAGGFKWKSPKTGKFITFHNNGLKPAQAADRVKAATNAYQTEKAGAVVPGKVFDNIQKHNGGKTPRPFTSVVNEDHFGTAQKAHTVSRHTIGAADAPNADAVAARAAFGMLGGIVGGAVKGAYTPIATAFQSVADADKDVAAAVNGEMTNNWNKYATQLVLQGGVDIVTPRAGGNVVAYESTKGASWPVTEIPKYLDPTQAGQKPLFYPDPRWKVWSKKLLKTGLIAGPKSLYNRWQLRKAPLTTDKSKHVPNVHVRVLASDNPLHNGWFIHSAYPSY